MSLNNEEKPVAESKSINVQVQCEDYVENLDD